MNTSDLHRRARITWLNIQISALRLAMSFESGITKEWKAMARLQGSLIGQRNNLRTPDEVRRIERERGLS